MTAKVRTCTPSDSEADLMQMMTESRIRHLPVVADGRLAGMVSIGDVVKLRMEEIEREADHMKTYIASGGLTVLLRPRPSVAFRHHPAGEAGTA